MTEEQKKYYKEYGKKYYQEHKEYLKEYHKRWRKENAKRWNELSERSRNKKAAELIAQGIINPFSVINKKAKPKYKEEQNGE